MNIKQIFFFYFHGIIKSRDSIFGNFETNCWISNKSLFISIVLLSRAQNAIFVNFEHVEQKQKDICCTNVFI